MAKDILRTRIESIQSRWRRAVLWADVWVGALFLIGLVVAACLLDLFLPLPTTWRLALWTLGPSLAVYGCIYLIATRKRRRLDRTRAALLAEKRYPHLEDQFVSAVEYAEDDSPPASPVSAHLIDRLLTTARTEARILSFTGVVPRKGLYRRLGAVALAVGTLWTLAAVYPDTVGVQLTRVLLPWRPVPPLLTTRVYVSPGDVTLRRGLDQSLEASLGGPSAEAARLHLRHADGDWQIRDMEPAGSDTFRYELYAVDDDLRYFVTAGNGRSDTFQVAVYEPPELQSLGVSYTYPPYTGLAPRQRDTGHVRGVLGTRVELTASYAKSLDRAFMVLATGDTLTARIDGQQAGFGFVLADSTSYELQAYDVDGYPDEEAHTFPIDAVPDAAPSVNFPDPGGDVWAIPADVVPVALVAKDDFGLSDLRFHYSLDGAEERTLAMGDFDTPGVATASGAHTFALRLLGMTTGSVITYYAEAGDHLAPEAQRTTSDLQVITVKPYQEQLAGFGGRCQGACQLLSARQAALLHDSWDLVRSPAPKNDIAATADTLAEEQSLLREDLSRFLAALDLELDPDGLHAGGAMEEAADDLADASPRLAVPDQQSALSALIRLEAKLPKVLGSGAGSGGGGGDSDGGSDAQVTSRAQLEEVVEDFTEQEERRRQTLFRQARDLLTRAKRELALQVALNGAWTAQVRGLADPGAADAAQTRRQQQETAETTAALAADIADLERGLDVGQSASLATTAAAGHMREAAGLAGEGRPQAAMARGVKAQTQLERGVDGLYLIVARHAGQVLPLLASALDGLGRRQAGMAQELQRALAGPAPWRLTAMRERQQVMTSSARDLRVRLHAAADEVGILSDSLTVAAQTAAQALLDSAVENRLEAIESGFGDRSRAEAVIPEQRHVAGSLRAIAAGLVAAISADASSEAAQVAAALNATQALEQRVRGGGSGGSGDGSVSGSGNGLDELEKLYEPLADEALQEGLGRLRAGGLGGDGGAGPARNRALATLAELESRLESRLRRLARQSDGLPFEGDDYPPEYRELVREYYRVLAEAGAAE